jgi:hypothetical protein
MLVDEIGKIGANRWVTITLLAILILAMFFIFYGVFRAGELASASVLIAIPAALGGLFTQLAYPKGDAPFLGCFVLPTLGIGAIIALGYFAKNEGVICIVMVLPIWTVAAISGAIVNKILAKFSKKLDDNEVKVRSAAWLVLPLALFFIEWLNPVGWQYREVKRDVFVDASPEQIWPLLISISSIQSTEGKANFTQDILGVPRPSSAKLVIIGRKMVRKAKWGHDVRFDENITYFDAGKTIDWDFHFPDKSVQNYTDQHISPDGPILKVISGGYRLDQQADGITRIRLVTRYRMRTSMPTYLSWWGEYLFGDIQANILEIIRERAEKI